MWAQYHLAGLYEHGLGVEKNIAEALKWRRKAAALGDEGAKAEVKRLESRHERPSDEGTIAAIVRLASA